jgi:5-formyltetrahydrofolate cyclo-ligase
MTHDGTGGWRRPPPVNASVDRNEVRRRMRSRRRSVSGIERRAATRAFAATLKRSGLLRRGRLHVAAYLAQGAEADPSALIALARERGASIYLPVIRSYRTMRMGFAPWTDTTRLRLNRFRMKEPDTCGSRASRFGTRWLDLVFVPLIAVDNRGFRLGSGLGFYDRRFAHRISRPRWRRPRLIGVAYEFQRIERLDDAPWDVPLDGLLTEHDYYRYTARHA